MMKLNIVCLTVMATMGVSVLSMWNGGGTLGNTVPPHQAIYNMQQQAQQQANYATNQALRYTNAPISYGTYMNASPSVQAQAEAHNQNIFYRK